MSQFTRRRNCHHCSSTTTIYTQITFKDINLPVVSEPKPTNLRMPGVQFGISIRIWDVPYDNRCLTTHFRLAALLVSFIIIRRKLSVCKRLLVSQHPNGGAPPAHTDLFDCRNHQQAAQSSRQELLKKVSNNSCGGSAFKFLQFSCAHLSPSLNEQDDKI